MAGTGPNVVVLIDNETDRDMTAHTLRNAGFAVTIAADDGDAASLVANRAIDLAVIPTRLRGRWTQCRRQRRPGLKVLFVADTLAFRPDNIGRGDALIARPIDPRRLLDRAYTALLGDAAPRRADYRNAAEFAIGAAKRATLETRRDAAEDAGAKALAGELRREINALAARQAALMTV